MFLVAVGFWNFLGAGIFGFLVNLPLVSYYEIGTALTANHAHAAMMGVYGMLAIGLALFCLRYLIPASKWPEKWARVAFWSTNIGLAWMCFATLLPLGIAQLYKSVNEGYWEARDLKFLTEDTNRCSSGCACPATCVHRRAARSPCSTSRASGSATRSSASPSRSPRTSSSPRSTSRVAGPEQLREAAAARVT